MFSELEAYLHANIPLSAAMGVRVIEASTECVILEAPMEPNVNHRGTVFGGSIASLATLAGWTLIHLLVEGIEPAPRLVIKSSAIEYLKPATGTFRATALRPSDHDLEAFLKRASHHRAAPLHLRSTVESEGVLAATLDGVFVALRPD